MAALEVSALLLELRAALVVDKAGGRIGKPAVGDSGWPARAGLRRRSPSPNPGAASALLSRDVMETSSAAVAESRSGPRNRAVR